MDPFVSPHSGPHRRPSLRGDRRMKTMPPREEKTTSDLKREREQTSNAKESLDSERNPTKSERE
nr:hypothetical protein Itr_chr10CG05520 [Ipomoea trifida]